MSVTEKQNYLLIIQKLGLAILIEAFSFFFFKIYIFINPYLVAFPIHFPVFQKLGRISHQFLIENRKKLRNEHAFVRILSAENQN